MSRKKVILCFPLLFADINYAAQQQQSIAKTEKVEDNSNKQEQVDIPEPVEENPPVPAPSTNVPEEKSPEKPVTTMKQSPPPSPIVNSPANTDDNNNNTPSSDPFYEDEIDHEIAQKYVEIQSDKESKSKLDKSDEDEWASWE
jgi:hypothetical protein